MPCQSDLITKGGSLFCSQLKLPMNSALDKKPKSLSACMSLKSNWFRSNSLFTSNRIHYLKTPTTKLLQSRVLFSHFSKINQKRFFEFDWTFYFIPITGNDIFCKRKRHTIWLAYNIPFASNSTFLHYQNYDNRPK